MILASAVRQVRGLGDNKFEVVTSLRTFVFRAEREGTTSGSSPTFHTHLSGTHCVLLVSLPLSLWPSDSLSSLVFLSCFLSASLCPSPPLSVCLASLSLTSLSLNVVIFCPHLFRSFCLSCGFLFVPFLSQDIFSVIGGFTSLHFGKLAFCQSVIWEDQYHVCVRY